MSRHETVYVWTVAQLFNCSRSTIDRMRIRGELEAFRWKEKRKEKGWHKYYVTSVAKRMGISIEEVKRRIREVENPVGASKL